MPANPPFKSGDLWRGYPKQNSDFFPKANNVTTRCSQPLSDRQNMFFKAERQRSAICNLIPYINSKDGIVVACFTRYLFLWGAILMKREIPCFHGVLQTTTIHLRPKIRVSWAIWWALTFYDGLTHHWSFGHFHLINISPSAFLLRLFFL